MWEKYTLFEETARVPLIISDPTHKALWGTRHAQPVESVDILPTTLSLLGVRRVPVLCPRGRLCADLDGRSLAEQVLGTAPSWEARGKPQRAAAPYAVSQMRRCLYGGNEKPQTTHPEDRWSAICQAKNKDSGSLMGYSLRSENWRYTAWLQYDSERKRPLVDVPYVAEELYSHVVRATPCESIPTPSLILILPLSF